MVAAADTCLNKPHWVYVLECPDGIVRYVGVTTDPHRRLLGHLSFARAYHGHGNPTYDWIWSIIESGKLPVLRTVEGPIDLRTAYAKESRIISLLVASGHRLAQVQRVPKSLRLKASRALSVG